MELVSVIIPCLNAAPFIARCLKSCFEQSYPHIEIILIDNNSTDESISIAGLEAKKANKNISIYKCRKQGTKYVRSMGNDIAQGKYIQMLDADDELGPNKIANQVAALEKFKEYSVAYCDWRWCFHQPDGKHFSVTFHTKQFDDYLLQLLLDNWHPPNVYLFRREVIEKINNIYSQDCETTASEDREFISLAALTGTRFLYVPGSFVYYNNWSEQQKTHKVKRSERAKSLAQIFGRLNEYARKQTKTDLREIHWRLLEQPWKPYKLIPGEVVENGSKYKITDQGKGLAFKISSFEAIIIAILQEYSGAYWLEHHARQILRILHRKALHAVGANLPVAEVHQKIIKNVNQLLSSHDEMVKNLIDPYRFDQDQIMDIPQPLSLQFLFNGPLYLPTFPIQRFFILEALQGLCNKGILAEA
jgi:glycosyltransferase involved in cell wall biosynthesis